MRSFRRVEDSELMTWKRRVARLAKIAVLNTACLSLNGCDYWPPALQAEIEMLRAELNDAWDDRQRLDQAVQDLRAQQTALQREADEKTRLNAELQHRVAILTASSQRIAAPTGRPERPSERLPSPVTRGSYTLLQLRHPLTRGPRVVQLQRLLRQHGIPIGIDGLYGPTTEAAVRGFQRTHGLSADGIVGAATYRLLWRKEPMARLTRQLWLQYPPRNGQDVILLQRALRRAGYRLAVDGHFGKETEVAVTRFQQKRGIEPDGIVGPQTWNALHLGR